MRTGEYSMLIRLVLVRGRAAVETAGSLGLTAGSLGGGQPDRVGESSVEMDGSDPGSLGAGKTTGRRSSHRSARRDGRVPLIFFSKRHDCTVTKGSEEAFLHHT